ncbi:putative pentatricopeptide repeat-containing protein, partial [Cucurbita argyrosperma subsp. argyrosperma]
MGSNYLRLLSYTKQLSFYANHGNHEQALALFHHMQASLALALDAHVFSLVLKSCTAIRRPQLGTAIHAHATKSSLLSSPFVACALVDMYGKSMSVSLARKLFDEIPHRTVVAWNAMLSLYTHSNMLPDALRLFEAMDVPPNTSSFNPIIAGLLDDGFKAIAFYRKMQQLQPDEITFIGVLKACSHVGLADEALDYFSRMQRDYGLQASSDHYSCLVDALSRAGRLHEAYEIIREMPVRVTAKAWGALLGACRNYGELELAEIAGKALFDIEPENAANYVLLGKMYASVGRHEEAQRLRMEMKERRVKAVPGSSWVVYQD